jgi:hypothetical protein
VPVVRERPLGRACLADTSVQALFRADDDQIELPGRAISPEEYRGTLLNRENDSPLDGLEELIIALHDIGEILERPALARRARIGRAADGQAADRTPTRRAAVRRPGEAPM